VAGSVAADGMRALNEAYHVLSDPARRAVYDGQMRGLGSAAGPAEPRPASVAPSPVPVAPSPFPWRMFAVAGVVASVAVAAASILSGPPDPVVPDGLLHPGSCVTIEPNTDAREVACTGAGDLVVRLLVAPDQACPAGTAAHRDRQGLGTACVAPAG